MNHPVARNETLAPAKGPSPVSSEQKSEDAAAPPNKADSSPTAEPGITGFSTVAEIPGIGAVTRLGRWEANNSSLYAADRRGYLEFDLHAPAADLYQLEVEGTSHNLFDVDPAFYLLLSIDGEFLGRTVLDAGPGRTGHVPAKIQVLGSGMQST